MSPVSKQAVRKIKKTDPEISVPKGAFPVVAIGASAGGLEAYKEFFHGLASDIKMAFVLVQHLDPTHQSLLTQIISKATRMPVEEVKSGIGIRPGRVYVIPPNAFMALSNDVFTLTPRSKDAGQHLAVNFFMRSLAESRGGSAIGIVFSGTGADGTLGLENIKSEGGITFAQEPETAKYDGMPRSAVSSGCVDFVLPPKGIAKELERLHRHPYITPTRVESFSDASADFRQVLTLLRRASGVDFSNYKPNTIHRRSLRRMAVLKLNSLNEYVKYLKTNPEEGEKLYEDVLIPVTSFFRDLETFEALKAQVYPEITKNKNGKDKAIRMWAPGCSTGEETYSLAMTLLEFLGDKATSFQIQIFGTDLNEKGIQKARTGVYRESIAEEISPERLERFFVKVDEGYRVTGMVRDLCIFARQNLIADPPFSQMDVVACRNLLIYVQPVLQKSVIPILHYGLKSTGFLVLGSSESVASFPELFTPLDKKHKIYRKKLISSRPPLDFARPYFGGGSSPQFPSLTAKTQESSVGETDVQAEADRLVLKHHAPAGVIINGAMDIVQFRGRTAPYLEPAPGKPSINLLKLAHSGLSIELRALVSAAVKKQTPVRKTGLAFESDTEKRTLNVSVVPLGGKDLAQRFYLVLFEELASHTSQANSITSQGDETKGRQARPELGRVKRELVIAQDALRSSIESEDALKEEFQSANEEILSANEELQSTNEELETSKEELQSANEELNTVNEELRNRNVELSQLNNDLSNVLDTIRIPILIVGPDLRIRRMTTAAAEVFSLLPSDSGGP